VTGDRFSVVGVRVLVTGGSSGIGAMVARGFAEAGADVAICGRDAATLGPLAAELGARPVTGDVSTEVGCAAIAAHFDAGLDVLVNNAGATSMAPLEDFDDAAWDDVLAVNLKGVAHLTRFLLPQLRASASGRVINVGSISAERVGDLDNYAYTSSKAALHHLTRHLARRLAPGITVNAIAPGPFESRMMASALAEHGHAIARAVPLRRIGTPDDVAGAAIYLASPAAAWVTGTVLTVDGGLSLT
jgi:NAD(P)-dependent dehydrogenase (short-subunit alcohol dehydrogenase family)